MAKNRKENGPLQRRKISNHTQRSGLYQLEKNLQLVAARFFLGGEGTTVVGENSPTSPAFCSSWDATFIRVKESLYRFGTISGLKCNLDKSIIMPFIAQDRILITEIERIGFAVVEKFTLLGMEIKQSMQCWARVFKITSHLAPVRLFQTVSRLALSRIFQQNIRVISLSCHHVSRQ